MAEKVYVEKRAALNAICKACDRKHPDDKENCPQKFAGCMEFYNVFELPAADVRPVVRGKWIDGAGKLVPWDEMDPGCPNGSAYCSICGDWLIASDEYPVKGLFCPNCGAKMDGGKDK